MVFTVGDMIQLGVLVASFGGLTFQVRSLAKDHEALGRKIDTLFNADADRREKVAEITSNVISLEQRITRAETHIDQMGRRVGIGNTISAGDG